MGDFCVSAEELCPTHSVATRWLLCVTVRSPPHLWRSGSGGWGLPTTLEKEVL